MTIFILAETYKKARHSAQQQKLPHSEWKHINTVEQLRGIEGPERNPKSPHTIQFDDSYYHIPDYPKILDFLLASGFPIR